MKLKKKYTDINEVMRMIQVQVMDGVPYASKNLPSFSNCDQIFNYLKRHVTYKNDPPGIELLQSLPTLMDNNIHGHAGFGDCDCFTIALLTIAYANGISDCYITLVGNNKHRPQHIYMSAGKGKPQAYDLTNPYYGMERKYKYKHNIRQF